MKVAAAYIAVGALLAAAHGFVGWVDGMNTWLSVAIKLGGALAAVGGAIKWCIGPGFRFVKRWTLWVRAKLELLEHVVDRLDGIEERLDRGEEHFQRIDDALELVASEEAQAVRRAIREARPVELRPDGGGVERRSA